MRSGSLALVAIAAVVGCDASKQSAARPPAPSPAPAASPPPAGEAQLLDLDNVLFSVPTLCDLAPPLAPGSAGGESAFALHEDDWRQVEMVAKADHAAVARMLEEVRRSEAANRRDVGWKSVYVRKEHPTPIGALGVKLADLAAAFGGAARPVDLASGGGARSRVRGGFAFDVRGAGTIYGYADGQRVLALAIVPARGAVDKAAAEKVNGFCRARGLEIIDWERREWVDPAWKVWSAR